MAITGTSGTFPRVDIATADTGSPAGQALAPAVLMERFHLLQNKVNEQTRLLQDLSDALRTLGQEKAALTNLEEPGTAQERHVSELDGRIAELSARVSVETSRLLDMKTVMVQAADAVMHAAKRENDNGNGSAIRRLV